MIKAIILSVTATLALVIFISSMFLNSILGAFWLAYTSIDALNKLKSSKQIVEKMKKNISKKKLNAPKKFIKNSSKRISATAVGATSTFAAAGLGAIFVVAAFEVADYCDDKKEINEYENILYQTNNDFNGLICLKEAKNDTVKLTNESLEKMKSFSSESLKSVASKGAAAWSSIKSIGFD